MSADRASFLLLPALLLFAGGTGCRARDPVWDTDPGTPPAYGLEGSAALVDDAAHRAVMLPVAGDLTISPVSIPIGRGLAASAVTADASKLVVLSHGDVPRTTPDAQAPSLTVIDGSTAPALLATYPLSDPLSGLALDPQARFAVVYPSPADTAFVENPNELSIVDLTEPAGLGNPAPVTLRSFGGQPKSMFFTPTLQLPAGPGRLLVALTDRDIGIIDLSVPAEGDITVPLSSSQSEILTPAQVTVTDGAPSRLGVRIADSSSVILVDLLPVPAGDTTHVHDFLPTPNVIDAGGTPTDIAFVTTDGGLRLAAAVPSQQALVLLDPATGVATSVALGAPLDRISIVTSVVGAAGMGADVALLWSTSSPSLAFVALGSTVGKPYKSVTELSLDTPVGQMVDVPTPNDRLKILASPSQEEFFVLDLVARTASPILATSSGGANLTVSPDGLRAWLLSASDADIASLSLADLHPQNLTLRLPSAHAFDVARKDGGRALIALHDVPLVDLTILDGTKPSLDTAVAYSSVLLGGVP